MTEHLIGNLHEFTDGAKLLLSVSGADIGIFRLDGAFHAWRNVCPHQGGPVCQGRIFKRVIDDLGSDKQHHGRAYDESQLHIVCPWHGAEFNIRTGAHAGIPDLSLTPIEIFVRDEKVYVRVD
jgi:nitrite reductase (NADH) small subunit